MDPKSYKSYLYHSFRGWKRFRTQQTTTERLSVIPSGLFPLALESGLLFIFRERLSSFFKRQVPFVFR